MNQEIKSCPFCGEEILNVAKKCKHCGSNLDENTFLTDHIKPTIDYGILLLSIPIIAIILLLFWVSNMAPIQSPEDTMIIILIITVIGTASIASIESRKSTLSKNNNKKTFSPTLWFFIMTFIWVIGYPLYLFKRSNYGLPNRSIIGVVITLILLVISFSLYDAIETQKKEIFNNIQELNNSLKELEKLTD